MSSTVDVSQSQATGKQLKKYVQELLDNIPEDHVLPSVILMNKPQYISVQNSRKLRRLKKPKQWEFLIAVSPPEQFLFWSKQHVMEVRVDES